MNILLNTLEYVDNLLKQNNDSNDINRIKMYLNFYQRKKMIIIIILIMMI